MHLQQSQQSLGWICRCKGQSGKEWLVPGKAGHHLRHAHVAYALDGAEVYPDGDDAFIMCLPL